MDDVIPGTHAPTMTRAFTRTRAGTTTRSDARVTPSVEAYTLLRFAFVVIPLVAGVDKFFDGLVHWDAFVAPVFAHMMPGHVHHFMMAVGVVEVIASALVAIKPRIGGYVAAAWLGLVSFQLLFNGAFFDIALRDMGLALGALALGRLATQHEGVPLLERHTTETTIVTPTTTVPPTVPPHTPSTPSRL